MEFLRKMARLFFIERKDVAFVEWAYELQPRDPHYVANPDWKPVLSAFQPFGRL